ncbi:MAG: phosphatidylglycerol lysyltransferase domain-containing protein [Desulfobacterales bacterium]|jgi:hypothetical protein|nr:phosphatidylglycerol lysyltransferase domain-containing protein [Desulfobacterales bacterium]
MNLKLLTLSDYPLLSPFFKHQANELCEYTLTAILPWIDEDFQPLAYINRDTLVICAEFAIHTDCRHLLLPLSPVREFCPRDLQDLALTLDRDAFWFVPAHYIQKHGWQETAVYFDITEQPGHANYIYKTEDLARLKGNRYSKKRNLINQFERTYLDKNRVQIEPIGPANAAACIEFIDNWCDAYPCGIETNEDLVCERQAVKCSIENIHMLALDSLLIRIDGEVSALGIATRLTDTMGVLHYEKAFTHIKGLYQYLDRECARHLFKGYPFINKESDMELPGLTQAKKSYYPVNMMKSYKLTVR